MCAALKVTRQGYYAWRKRPPSAHDLRDAELAAKISEITEDDLKDFTSDVDKALASEIEDIEKLTKEKEQEILSV